MLESLVRCLNHEISRVRKMREQHRSTWPGGMFDYSQMRTAVDEGVQAVAKGDEPAMLRAYQALKKL